MITALGGGVGAAKFLKGLSNIIPGKDLTVIINTGDDIDIYGFRVSPDIDTIIYRLADKIDTEKGWGIQDETFNCLDSLSGLGYETWFQLGDKDLATQIFKRNLIKQGFSQSEVTAQTTKLFGIENITLLPMTEDNVETWIETELGELHFQEYYIKHNMEPEVFGINIKGIREARPGTGVIEAIESSDLIIICPSNPIISIGPIIKVKGVREALVNCRAQIIAISPLIGGKPLRGPADRLMKGLGLEVSTLEIVNLYKDFLSLMVLDSSDREEEEKINNQGVRSFVTDTLISDDNKSEQLSKKIIEHINY
ncbi:MAG: 2-phospho-L-lactate transferase [Thermodesulfobacteriota bacterium]